MLGCETRLRALRGTVQPFGSSNPTYGVFEARLGTLIREFCSTPRIGNLRQGKADGFRRTRREQSWNALLQGSASIPRCGPVDQCVCVLPINICLRAGEDAVL